jgi:ABC-type Fe3+-hydroxamate transport system substrate-binding protein
MADDSKVQPIVIRTIQPLLSGSATCLLLLVVLALSGCSSKVEVERETTTTSPAAEQTQPVVTERSRTAVAVDLTRGQQPVRTVSGDPVEFPHDANVVIVEGCLHVHIHLGKNDQKAEKLAVELLRELRDGRCEWHRH